MDSNRRGREKRTKKEKEHGFGLKLWIMAMRCDVAQNDKRGRGIRGTKRGVISAVVSEARLSFPNRTPQRPPFQPTPAGFPNCPSFPLLNQLTFVAPSLSQFFIIFSISCWDFLIYYSYLLSLLFIPGAQVATRAGITHKSERKIRAFF
jgi:hypothetical protein